MSTPSVSPVNVVCLTDREVADRLSVSRRQVWSLLRSDPHMPSPIRIGHRTRWLEHEISSYLLAKKEGGQ